MACVTAEIRFEFCKVVITLKSLLWLVAVVLDRAQTGLLVLLGDTSSVPARTSFFLPFVQRFIMELCITVLGNFPLLEKWGLCPRPTPVQAVGHSTLSGPAPGAFVPCSALVAPVLLSPCWSPLTGPLPTVRRSVSREETK